jgi:hypothetical protein
MISMMVPSMKVSFAAEGLHARDAAASSTLAERKDGRVGSLSEIPPRTTWHGKIAGRRARWPSHRSIDHIFPPQNRRRDF